MIIEEFVNDSLDHIWKSSSVNNYDHEDDYFVCEKCNTVVYINVCYMSIEYKAGKFKDFVYKSFEHLKNNLNCILISCDEVIIKNILE